MLKKQIGKALIKGAVAMGVVNAAVWTAINHQKNKVKDMARPDEESNDVCKHFEVVMKGEKIRLGEDDAFKKVKVKTLMGGVDLDLRSAVITEDVTIKCKSIMGGINIRVPENVNVIVKGNVIMGGILNFAKQVEGEGVPTIHIEALQIMGSLCIKPSPPDEETKECQADECQTGECQAGECQAGECQPGECQTEE